MGLCGKFKLSSNLRHIFSLRVKSFMSISRNVHLFDQVLTRSVIKTFITFCDFQKFKLLFSHLSSLLIGWKNGGEAFYQSLFKWTVPLFHRGSHVGVERKRFRACENFGGKILKGLFTADRGSQLALKKQQIIKKTINLRGGSKKNSLNFWKMNFNRDMAIEWALKGAMPRGFCCFRLILRWSHNLVP